jgi:hypothetical protein
MNLPSIRKWSIYLLLPTTNSKRWWFFQAKRSKIKRWRQTQNLEIYRFQQIWKKSGKLSVSWNEKLKPIRHYNNQIEHLTTVEQSTRWHNNVPQQQDSIAATSLCRQPSNTNEICNIVWNHFNSIVVEAINDREEYSYPNRVKRWHGGGPHRSITNQDCIVKDFQRKRYDSIRKWWQRK